MKIALIALLSLMLLTAMVAYFFFKSTLPVWEGILASGGIAEAVEVRRNPHGVPAIRANSDADLMFAIGFVHAQDRLFQMDLQRRAASGRLAQVLGAGALPRDMEQLYLQADAGIDRSLRALRPKVKMLLEHYCRGINYFLASQSLPPEFHVLRYAPENWRPRDVVAAMKYLEGALSRSGGELHHARLLAGLAPGEAARRSPLAPRPDWDGRGDWARILAAPELAPRLAAEAEAEQEGAAGSAWAVAGSRTRSGLPCLANDFYSPPRLPSHFYQLAGKCPTLDISGNTLPGVPFIFSGRNWQLGWGVVPAGSDTLDYFLLERHPQDNRLYRCDGEWLPLERREVRIPCRGRPDVALTLRVSRFGPVIEAGGGLMAVRSLVQHRTHALEALCAMNMARSQHEFVQALHRFTAPALSVVYADRKGNIGACRTGLLPLRGRGDGQVPIRIGKVSDLWQGFAEPAGEPLLANPAKGWLCSFDLEPAGRAAPLFYRFDAGAGFRSQRQAQALAGAWRLDAAAAARLQNDTRVAGEALVGLIRDMPLASDEARHVRSALQAWDFNAVEGEGAAFFFEFERRLAATVFAPAFRQPALAFGVPTRLLYAALASPGLLRRDELAAAVEACLKETYAAYREKTRRQDDGWRWENLHTVIFRSPMAGIFPLRPLFERGPFSLRGGLQGLPHGEGAPGGRFSASGIAAYRMVLDMGETSNSLLIYPGGQSGHPLSPAYDDQLDMFLSQKYLEMEGPGRRLYSLRIVPAPAAGRL